MSNFDFLNNDELIREFPAYELIYKYVCKAEKSYYNDHMVCAMNIRFALEEFCFFVSDLKKISYIREPKMVGDFLCPENRLNFLNAINGNVNYECVVRVNEISRTYAHSRAKKNSEDYHDMFPCLFVLVLWMYKSLFGMKSELSYNSFDEKKIPLNENTDISYYGVQRTSRESEQLLKKFPNSNLESLYVVKKDNEKIVAYDMDGNLVEEYIYKKDADLLEKEKKSLLIELKQVESIRSKEIKLAEEELEQKKSEIEQLYQEIDQIRILYYKEKDINNSRTDNLNKLQEKLECTIAEKNKLEEELDDKVLQLDRRYTQLRIKYEDVLNEKETIKDKLAQVKEMIECREKIQSDFENEKLAMLTEIADMKKALQETKKQLSISNIKEEEYEQFVRDLRKQLSQKEDELKNYISMSEEKLSHIQREAGKDLRKYRESNMELEQLLTRIMVENVKYRNELEEYNKINAKNSLQVVCSSVMQINKGYFLYQTNANEQKLRERLLQVKDYYESQIKELKEKLGEKEKELDEIQRSKEIIVENITEAINMEDVVVRQRSFFNKRTISLLICAVVLLGLVVTLSERLVGLENTLDNDSGQTGNMDMIATTNTLEPTETNTSEPTEINTPEPTETNIPVLTTTGTPVPTSSGILENEQKLDKALKEVERIDALPDEIKDIRGVSSLLLEDIDTMTNNAYDLYDISRWGDETEHMKFIGDYTVANFGYLNDEFCTRGLYQVDSIKVAKFAYNLMTRYPSRSFGIAIEPRDISSNIDYETTLEELELLLGKASREYRSSGKPTYFTKELPERETYYVEQFSFFNGVADNFVGAKKALIFIYNEDKTEIIDYVYYITFW